ncbi:Glycoside hydrolase family 13 [Fusarium keratoplasticum]|uniref:Glycoside hydrolase family 13 n=1 Tax=Fusarium keratoplasticum TaxID=1328300 RepID=A0ACC0R383_9HYPO|nr:Glycoside hydrolase family 13 [Fusarium keratoplasticum]KAI8674669.1 Glycoside hydrolase family 13 [Fusarium keratoplasticum]
MPTSTPPDRQWWKELVVYQIYPASFLDSDADGLGDLPGIISKLDYIQSVGATAIWLSPIFKSPQHDMGYDVSDYRDIHRPYGTVEDVEALIRGCHDRGIKVLLDLVVNHTSHEHEWFRESRSSRTSPKRDWYFWRDPKFDSDGTRQPPNNWASIFGGSAWTWDEQTGQYYLSLFLPEQPDLNWANEEMRRATYADMQFWLDKGADGFRIDSMNLMSKHPDLPDAPITRPDSEFQPGNKYFASGPRMHDYIREMREEVLDKYACMTVGELGFTKDEDSVASYVAKDRHELNMLFTGDIVDMDFGVNHKYERDDFRLSKLRDITSRWQGAMPKFDGWNSVYMDNHDSGRSLSRYGSDLPEYRKDAAKMLAVYLGTLSGTLFLLQGQEIGMANAPESWTLDDYIDVEGLNYYKSELNKRGPGADMSDVMREMRLKARDNGRLPMQWNTDKNAGFTQGSKPWMRVNDDFSDWNVAQQEKDEDSVLAFWRQVLKLRQQEKDVFVYGRFDILPEYERSEQVFAYTMTSYDGRVALVLLSFSDKEQNVELKRCTGWKRLLGKNAETLEAGGVELKPYEGVVYAGWE